MSRPTGTGARRESIGRVILSVLLACAAAGGIGLVSASLAAARQGQATDVEIQAKEILETKQRLNKILAKHTGQDLKKIEQDVERDFYMGPVEAKEYGLIDSVIERRPKEEKKG